MGRLESLLFETAPAATNVVTEDERDDNVGYRVDAIVRTENWGKGRSAY